MKIFSYLFIIFILLSLALAASPKRSGLGVRNAHAIAYDRHRDRLVLFGGADATKVCGDTWEWDGKEWTQMSVEGPIPRTFPSMAYDNHRKRIVLFGGNRVLFGDDDDRDTFLNDTWEFDGTQWMQFKVNGPSARSSAALAYDEYRKTAVLFGGRAQTAVSDETWEWNGSQWKQNSATPPPPRFNSAAVYDPMDRHVIRFGGFYRGDRFSETWGYDGKAWRLLTSLGPAARNHTSMVYDSKRKKILLFGGHDGENVFGDMWMWHAQKWVLMQAREPEKRVDNGH